MNTTTTMPEWAAVCVKLLQGPLYKDSVNDRYWSLLSTYESNIQEYFSTLGVFVVIDQADGYAFLKQMNDMADSDDGQNTNTNTKDFPVLIRKSPLSAEVSFICILLREAFDSFDSSQNDSAKLVLKESDIVDMISLYIKEDTDQKKYIAKLDSYLTQIADLTFIKEIKSNSDSGQVRSCLDRTFEIRRILRAKIDARFIQEFKEKLYGAQAEQLAQDGQEATEQKGNSDE